jgi:anti-sigma factor RsiW
VPPPDCSSIISLLSDYLDGRLPAAVRTDLEHHIGGCSDCAAFVESFRSTVTLLKSLTDADLPEELRVRLKAFLDDRCNS